jgi:hypothetical protein
MTVMMTNKEQHMRDENTMRDVAELQAQVSFLTEKLRVANEQLSHWDIKIKCEVDTDETGEWVIWVHATRPDDRGFTLTISRPTLFKYSDDPTTLFAMVTEHVLKIYENQIREMVVCALNPAIKNWTKRVSEGGQV